MVSLHLMIIACAHSILFRHIDITDLCICEAPATRYLYYPCLLVYALYFVSIRSSTLQEQVWEQTKSYLPLWSCCLTSIFLLHKAIWRTFCVHLSNLYEQNIVLSNSEMCCPQIRLHLRTGWSR